MWFNLQAWIDEVRIFGTRGAWKRAKNFCKADAIEDLMIDHNVRKIVIEVAPSGHAELTFYWGDGNTDEPWSTTELITTSALKAGLRKHFGSL